MSYKPSLKLGDWTAICDRCGFKFKASSLKHEWQGLIVCNSCWEPRHEMDYIEGIPDDQSVPWTRPEQDDVFVAVTNGVASNFTFTQLRISTPDGSVVGTSANVVNAGDASNINIAANTITYPDVDLR